MPRAGIAQSGCLSQMQFSAPAAGALRCRPARFPRGSARRVGPAADSRRDAGNAARDQRNPRAACHAARSDRARSAAGSSAGARHPPEPADVLAVGANCRVRRRARRNQRAAQRADEHVELHRRRAPRRAGRRRQRAERQDARAKAAAKAAEKTKEKAKDKPKDKPKAAPGTAGTEGSSITAKIRSLLVGASVVVIVLGTFKMAMNLLDTSSAPPMPAMEEPAATLSPWTAAPRPPCRHPPHPR